MKFPNGSGKRTNMMYPTDNTYWDKLKKFVDYEPIKAITPELRGVLASIGIIKGKPFDPTDQQKKLLDKAVKKQRDRGRALESDVERELRRQEELLRSIDRDKLADRALDAAAAEEVDLLERANTRIAPRAAPVAR